MTTEQHEVAVPPNERSGTPAPTWLILTFSGAIAIAAAVAAVTLDRTLLHKPQTFGTVDIAAVLETSELVFTDMIVGPNATDANRAAAFDLVKETGPKLEAAIDSVRATCDCVLLAKAAVIGDRVVDYTPQVMTAMGLDPAQVQAMQGRVRSAMARIGGDKP